MENSYCIYKHTSPSGKVYIGTTKHKPEVRWGKGQRYKGNEYFYKAICKYGWDNFTHDILATDLSYEQASSLEIELIASCDSTNRFKGYNIEHGGNVPGTHSEETRRKISAASMGNKSTTGRKMSDWHKQQLRNANLGSHRNIGLKKSPETCAALSKALTGRKFSAEHIQHIKDNRPNTFGENNPMYGKVQSENTKRLISEKAKARPMTESRRQHLQSIAKTREVEQLDFNGNVLQKFNKIIDAANSVGAFAQNIYSVCNGKQGSCKGYKWRYCDESGD